MKGALLHLRVHMGESFVLRVIGLLLAKAIAA